VSVKEFSWPFVVRWAGAYAATECAVVIVASLTLATSWPWVVLVAAIEGTLLGLVQGLLLRELRPHFVRDWTLATIAGVLLGRAIEFAGDGSALAATILSGPFALQIFAGAALGALVGAAAGSFQALLLRDYVRRPARWVGVCALAWAIGLPSLLLVGFATGQLSGSVPVWHAVVAILMVFAAIGAVTGAIEGGALAAMLRAAGRSRAAHARLSPALEHGA
jgi:hypothetical protein